MASVPEDVIGDPLTERPVGTVRATDVTVPLPKPERSVLISVSV